ncbi:UNVERIFIED_CONTAM: hypothetical protein GTU68_006887 [Idotea baltica]
MSTSP